MTGTLALRAGLADLLAAPAGERKVVLWAVQALLPWTLTLVHPSVWGLASATVQLLFGGSLLMATGARLRLVARGALLLAVAGSGVDPSDVVGIVAQLLRGGLESALLIAAVSLVLGVWRSRAARQSSR
jgi:hypothetical protein